MNNRNVDAWCDALVADAQENGDEKMVPVIELARQFLTDINRIADAVEEMAKIEMRRDR